MEKAWMTAEDGKALWTSASLASRLRRLFFIGEGCLLTGLVLIPFNGVPGPAILGELRGELSVVAFAPAILLMGILIRQREVQPYVRSVLAISLAICMVIAASLLFNYFSIAESTFHNRNGLIKFATTFMVIGYGLSLASATIFFMRADPQRIGAAITLSAVLALLYAVFEIISRAGFGTLLFKTLDGFLRGGWTAASFPWSGSLPADAFDQWDSRIRSVCFEPPAFGNFCGLAFPWVAHHCLRATGKKKLTYRMFLASFLVLIVFAQARTGLLLLGSCMLSYLVLRYVYLNSASGELSRVVRATVPVALLAGFGLAALYYLLAYPALEAGVVAGDSVSNLSRLASQVAAAKVFAAHPIFGVGLGQFAYYEAAALPPWGYLSYELGPTLIHPEAPWPAVYSIYPRLAAECGVFGIVGWPLLWLTLLVQVVKAGRVRIRDGLDPGICHPAALTCILILVSGVATDSFRTPMIWIGLAAAHIFIRQTQGRKLPVQGGRFGHRLLALGTAASPEGTAPAPSSARSPASPPLRPFQLNR